MKIISMTATFGKLDNETLVLDQALNVLAAPNEWGKSTWCAFLTAMLYGIDTRERSRGENLAEKEKYLPWSGKPMEGTLRLIHGPAGLSSDEQVDYSTGKMPLALAENWSLP